MTKLPPKNLLKSKDLSSKLEKARKEYKEGKAMPLKSHEEIDKYFESL